ncbi:hypothetical protein FSP39_001729 [Pinctada imbricata]|uniref:Uncharacterized protein n=1 Tax=Pinctada imbricata TaxID=66713 RepID=A0AA88XV73_PINIB|nr:hypothetical protein FSP39_001729 [Pinctada imbricata]
MADAESKQSYDSDQKSENGIMNKSSPSRNVKRDDLWPKPVVATPEKARAKTTFREERYKTGLAQWLRARFSPLRSRVRIPDSAKGLMWEGRWSPTQASVGGFSPGTPVSSCSLDPLTPTSEPT